MNKLDNESDDEIGERIVFVDEKKEISAKPQGRPNTPHIDIFNLRGLQKNDSDNIFKNFSSFMKQIVDTQNSNFLNGDLKVIEYILSKYLNIDYSQVKNVEKISIKINSEYGLLNQFGLYLPNLKVLKINNSLIPSISEIGTSFQNLKVLQMNNCTLKDLSGIICFQNLEIFEAKNNKISDLIELEMCTALIKINLANNLIADEDNLFFIANLPELKWVNLENNPICRGENYMTRIREILPQVEVFDKDEEIVITDKDLNVPPTKTVATIVPSVNDPMINEITKTISKDIFVNQSNSTSSSSPGSIYTHSGNDFFNLSKSKVSVPVSIVQNIKTEELLPMGKLKKTGTSFKDTDSLILSSSGFDKFKMCEKIVIDEQEATRGENNILAAHTTGKRGNSLKPVIVKKEENATIQTLRQSIDDPNKLSVGQQALEKVKLCKAEHGKKDKAQVQLLQDLKQYSKKGPIMVLKDKSASKAPIQKI